MRLLASSSRFATSSRFPFAALIAVLSLSACNRPSPDEREAADAQDVAAVEAANKRLPPAKPLTPQPILFPDIRAASLYGPGCAFVAQGGGLGAIVMTQAKRAAIKPAEEVVILAADPGSTQMPNGTWSHYVGKEHALTLTRQSECSDASNWTGKLVITDARDQVVYEATGLVQCRN